MTLRDKNPQFIGISATREKQIANARATENLFDARLRNTARGLRRGDGARHLHTKLSGVTVIFFLL